MTDPVAAKAEFWRTASRREMQQENLRVSERLEERTRELLEANNKIVEKCRRIEELRANLKRAQSALSKVRARRDRWRTKADERCTSSVMRMREQNLMYSRLVQGLKERIGDVESHNPKSDALLIGLLIELPVDRHEEIIGLLGDIAENRRLTEELATLEGRLAI